MEHITGWRKSSYSSTNGGNCVETSNNSRDVLVRDSQDKDGAHLAVPASAWTSLTRRLKKS
jgi:Domain of unknown function (DUF397)